MVPCCSKLLPSAKSPSRLVYWIRWASSPATGFELSKGPDGYLLRPRRIDYARLGTLADKIPTGHPSFALRTFREKPYAPGLRD